MYVSEEAYAAFMLDHAAGALSQGERLAADLHRALSVEGARTARIWEAVGGAILEQGGAAGFAHTAPPSLDEAILGDAGFQAPPHGDRLRTYADWVQHFITTDPMDQPWRKTMFGPRTAPTGLPMTELLRMDPGERAPRHTHGRRDVSLVLCGSFADEYGVYKRGDIAFSHAGIPHQPRTAGDEPCVCLVAIEPGKPLSAILGAFGLLDR